MKEHRNAQELDRIIQEFFDFEVTKILEAIYRQPKQDGPYDTIMDIEQMKANYKFHHRMNQYAEKYIAEHSTDYIEDEITHVLLEEKFRRGGLIFLIRRHEGQITSSNLEGILKEMDVDIPNEEPSQDRLQNYKPKVSVEESLALRRKRLIEQGHILKQPEERTDVNDDGNDKE